MAHFSYNPLTDTVRTFSTNEVIPVRHWTGDPLEQPNLAILDGENGVEFEFEARLHFTSFLCVSSAAQKICINCITVSHSALILTLILFL